MKKIKTLVITLLIVGVLGLIAYMILSDGTEYFMKQVYPVKYEETVLQAAEENNLEPEFVFAVIKAESDFDPQAESRVGAKGLMQIMPETFTWLQSRFPEETTYTEEDLFNPEISIRYGCQYLALLINEYSDKKTAVCAYNAGMGTVNGWLADPEISKDGITLDEIPWSETRNYAAKIFDYYEKYKELYNFDGGN